MNGAAYQPELSLFIEILVAAVIMFAFVISAMLTLRERHRDMSAWHVFLGAGIYGAVFGAIIGFVIVPLRAALLDGNLPPQTAGTFGFAALLLIIALRRGALARLPFLGPQVKAFRRASLRRQIEAAQSQLDKLMPSETGQVIGN